LMEGMVAQIEESIKDNPMVERMIRTRTELLLRALAGQPEKLEPLIRAEADATLSYLLAHPEKLEPLFQLLAQSLTRAQPAEPTTTPLLEPQAAQSTPPSGPS